VIPPLYRALCEAILLRDGVLEPSVSATGHFRDGSSNLLEAPDGVALAVQALAFADTVTGARIGHEVVEALTKQLGIQRLKARYDVQCSRAHKNSSDLIDALHDAARFLAAQLRSEESPA